jgi:signal transduction histidine kinase
MRLLVQELRVRIDTMESERKELQKHLMQAQKIEGLGTMATGVAHDFNNLLAAILGNTSILLNAVAKDSPVRENALQIQTSASQAAELTNKMAIYSGRCRFDPVPIDINAVIRDTADIVRGLVYRAIDVDTRLADDLPSIHADPAHVRELLTQLVRNASEAIMTRGRKGRIGIGTGVLDCDGKYLAGAVLQEKQAEGRYVYIEVTDDGCGIPSEVQTRMFDPFFTTKIRAQGMGLAVVLGIVRAHGGVIRVTSAPAEGATFRILLPGDEIRPTFE